MTSTTTENRSNHGSGRSSGTNRNQIKSRERVRDLAEVYTHQREVVAMLGFIPDMFETIDSTFLEPACGNGNFLVEILRRKLTLVGEYLHGEAEGWFEIGALRAAMSIYAIDISEENIAEAHERMTEIVAEEFERRNLTPTSGFTTALAAVLGVNIICGDSLNACAEISFLEWKAVSGGHFTRTPFWLEEPEHDLFYVPPEPLAPIHYAELGRGQRR